MKKLLIALTLLFGCVSAVYAGPKISKEQKEVCKTLKKNLGAKLVEVFENAPESPFYRVTDKDYKCGIADKDGNLILPLKYEAVIYIPELTSDRFTVNLVNDKDKPTGETVAVVTQPSADGFWGFTKNDGAEVFDRQGQSTAKFPKHNFAVFNGNYVYLSDSPLTMAYEYPHKKSGSIVYLSLYAGKGYESGKLVRGDGAVVIDKADYIEIVSNAKCTVYETTNDMGAKVKGMKCLDNSGFDIPAEFYEVYNYQNEWKVRARATDDYAKTYVPTKAYNTTYRDKGEALFANRKFDEVVDFYSREGIEAPWAKFYAGAALMEKIISSQMRYRVIVESMESGSGLPANEENVVSDANLILQSLNMSGNLLKAYIGSGDSSFRSEAESYLSQVQYRSTQMAEYVQRYNNVRGHAAMVTSEAEARQARMLGSVLGIFANYLGGNSGSSSGKTNVTVPATGGRMIDKTHVSDEVMGAAVAGGYVPESSVSNGQSTNNGSNYNRHEAQCRGCNGSGLCQHCGGSGLVNDNKSKCSLCKGRGKCVSCAGRGKIHGNF